MEEEIKERKSIGGAGFEDGGGGGDVKAAQAVLSCFVNQAAMYRGSLTREPETPVLIRSAT